MNTLRMIRAFIAVVFVVSLIGCANYDRDGIVESRRMTDNVNINRAGPLNYNKTDTLNGESPSNTANHQNTRVEASQELAELIADLPQVDTANVLLTDRNAYIAVFLDDDNGANESMNRQNRQNEHTTLERSTNRTQERAMDRNRERTSRNRTDRNVNDRNRNDLNRNDHQLQMNRAANRDDARLDNTRMRRQFDQAQDVTTDLKDRIATLVKEHSPHVRNVYVSANPDFMDRINGFIDQIQEGNAVQGLINEVNTTVERMFPTNAGPNVAP